MNKQQYLQWRNNMKFPPQVFYEYMQDVLPQGRGWDWLRGITLDEFRILFLHYMNQFGSMVSIEKIVKHFDAKFHIHILSTTFNHVLKVY